jgi:MFS family permease
MLTVTFPFLFLAAAITSIFGGYSNLWGGAAAEWGFEDPYVASLMISAGALFNLVTPVLGWAVDKFGPARASFGVVTIQVFASLGLIFFHSNVAILLILTFLFADVNAILLGVMPVLYRLIFGPKNFTQIQAYMQFGLGILGGFGAPLLALIATSFGSYTATLWFGIILCFLIAAAFLTAYAFAKKVTWEDGTHPDPWSKDLYTPPPEEAVAAPAAE